MFSTRSARDILSEQLAGEERYRVLVLCCYAQILTTNCYMLNGLLAFID